MVLRRIAILAVTLAIVAGRVQVLAAEPPVKQTIDDAVADGLKWLAAQQRDDGGWAFDGPGMKASSPTGATGLVLLAFLEAGQTHREGRYKDHARAGLAFLIREMSVDGDTGDLRGANGDMIAHAAAACALCEAYAMTHDKELKRPAALAANFIVRMQDKEAGGWQRDAMSGPSMLAFGWQLLALKRAHMALLGIDKHAPLRAIKYLDTVQLDGGRQYAENKGEREQRATAVGLFARVVLGWKRSDERLVAGTEAVGDRPQAHDAMHNFFAHQLHYGASAKTWPTWRDAIRTQLLETQQIDGEQSGSWFDPDDRDADRGRLQQTALNSMILSMFRRGPLPIFPGPEPDDDFPL